MREQARPAVRLKREIGYPTRFVQMLWDTAASRTPAAEPLRDCV
jgi:hypothetical protein